LAEPGNETAGAEELIRQLRVSDILLGTLASLVQIGYAKLGEGDGEQTRLAIEALRAVLPVLEGAVPDDAVRDLRQATANLQLAYASKLSETPPAPDGESAKENEEET
jgi:hypothetical protein